eukprot:5283686-Alexandrium_andersonii.AAC.1
MRGASWRSLPSSPALRPSLRLAAVAGCLGGGYRVGLEVSWGAHFRRAERDLILLEVVVLRRALLGPPLALVPLVGVVDLWQLVITYVYVRLPVVAAWGRFHASGRRVGL